MVAKVKLKHFNQLKENIKTQAREIKDNDILIVMDYNLSEILKDLQRQINSLEKRWYDLTQ